MKGSGRHLPEDGAVEPRCFYRKGLSMTTITLNQAQAKQISALAWVAVDWQPGASQQRYHQLYVEVCAHLRRNSGYPRDGRQLLYSYTS